MPPLFLGSAVALMLVAVATPVTVRQGTSEISGRIVDQNGGVLSGATKVLTNENTGIFRETRSGADGAFFAPQVFPGSYRLSAKLQGFRTSERRGLVLQVGATLVVNLSLEIGPPGDHHW